MTKVLRELGLAKITVHGFRSSFTDWAAEKTRFPKEVVDKALAHKLLDRVEAAYRRTVFFARRRQLMVSWARYLTSGAGLSTTLRHLRASQRPDWIRDTVELDAIAHLTDALAG